MYLGGVLYDHKFYKVVIKSTVIYGYKCWIIKMRRLRWICGVTGNLERFFFND